MPISWFGFYHQEFRAIVVFSLGLATNKMFPEFSPHFLNTCVWISPATKYSSLLHPAGQFSTLVQTEQPEQLHPAASISFHFIPFHKCSSHELLPEFLEPAEIGFLQQDYSLHCKHLSVAESLSEFLYLTMRVGAKHVRTRAILAFHGLLMRPMAYIL